MRSKVPYLFGIVIYKDKFEENLYLQMKCICIIVESSDPDIKRFMIALCS
ncbi:hypothetical protein SBF1_3140003 [Candidatus Desulfosporosinus infrequens]|uniref:Uncharacterized protein n=1 Tax=Candidatus Desulfosporosinus infrequens TaxID=2043169 RepID=A0A2U3KYX5_9FIRM|nr:hypothetical protein SBF1_3140003 [Candidatus Desulfosporosinus infrequens]